LICQILRNAIGSSAAAKLSRTHICHKATVQYADLAAKLDHTQSGTAADLADSCTAMGDAATNTLTLRHIAKLPH
jgi:hypothetical protein